MERAKQMPGWHTTTTTTMRRFKAWRGQLPIGLKEDGNNSVRL